MVSRRLRYTWWAAPRSQVGPPTFQGTSREALCVHLCRLRGVVFSPGSSTYNREQEGSAAAILSRVPCPLLEPNRFFASCSSLFFPSLRMFVNGTSGERKFEGRKFGAFEREWCEERILIFSLVGTEVYQNNWAEERAKVKRWTRVISNLESGSVIETKEKNFRESKLDRWLPSMGAGFSVEFWNFHWNFSSNTLHRMRSKLTLVKLFLWNAVGGTFV